MENTGKTVAQGKQNEEELELELDKLRDLNSSLEKENENQGKVIEQQKREIIVLQTTILRMTAERYGN